MKSLPVYQYIDWVPRFHSVLNGFRSWGSEFRVLGAWFHFVTFFSFSQSFAKEPTHPQFRGLFKLNPKP